MLHLHMKSLSKTTRKPLQDRNTIATTKTTTNSALKPKRDIIELCNKENVPPADLFDVSLAEELSTIRKKLDRLRVDYEETEKKLKERDLVLISRMKEVKERGEFQKHLEMEVDRLYRLNELRSYCMRITPIRSLREKEEEKKNGLISPVRTVLTVKEEKGEKTIDSSSLSCCEVASVSEKTIASGSSNSCSSSSSSEVAQEKIETVVSGGVYQINEESNNNTVASTSSSS